MEKKDVQAQVSDIFRELTKTLQEDCILDADDCCYTVPYAGEELSPKEIKQVLDAEEPADKLFTLCYEKFCSEDPEPFESYVAGKLEDAFAELDKEKQRLVEEYLDDNAKELMDAWAEDQSFSLNYNEMELANNQHIKLDLMMDTYDDGLHNMELLDTSHPLPKEASMLTVAKGQGKYGELMKAVRHIRKGARVEHPFESPFVDSAIDELSCCHGSGRMTFLSDVSLLDAMEIAQAIHKEEKLEKATGTITLDKHTVCGLFDPTGQAGSSLLGVMLEKPLKLKLKDLTLADDRMFDRKNECYPWRSWSATEVFGLCKDAWRKETISAFKPMTPKQLKKAQLEQASTR